MEDKKKIYTRADLKDLNIALVHYWLVTWRGGEKVVESLLKIFPKADIYTLFYDEKGCGLHLKGHKVYSSWLNLPKIRFQYQKLFPFYPSAVRSLKLRRKYDLILSSESGPAKGITNQHRSPHLCYIHSPMRYCWGFTDFYLESLPKWSRSIAKMQFEKLRKWDETTIDNVDHYVANSQNVADRVSRYYGKTAQVCYPPIALDLFEETLQPSSKEFYLSFGALTPYKNIELLVDTFNQLDKQLVVIGDGSEKERLEKKAKANIRFLGALPFADVLATIRRSKALLFPGEEDFGMIPLEVMSQGVPVIAYGKGGALETVVENRDRINESSGLFFDQPTSESLLEAIDLFERVEEGFDPEWIRKHARSFGEDHFQERICQLVLNLLNRNFSS